MGLAEIKQYLLKVSELFYISVRRVYEFRQLNFRHNSILAAIMSSLKKKEKMDVAGVFTI